MILLVFALNFVFTWVIPNPGVCGCVTSETEPGLNRAAVSFTKNNQFGACDVSCVLGEMQSMVFRYWRKEELIKSQDSLCEKDSTKNDQKTEAKIFFFSQK